MTGEQILSDREIFRRAVQLPLEQRAPYLDQACNDDAELRQEVESLLQAHDTSNSFMKMPALELSAEAVGLTKEAQHWLKQATQAIDHPATIAQKKLAENWDTILPLQLLRQEAERMLVSGDDDRTTMTAGRN